MRKKTDEPKKNLKIVIKFVKSKDSVEKNANLEIGGIISHKMRQKVVLVRRR